MYLSYQVYRASAAIAFAASLFSVAYALTTAPSRTASRLGLRGLKRQRALRQSASWARLEPFVRWGGVRLNGLIPAGIHASIDTFLQRSGDFLGLIPEEFVVLSVLSCAAGAMFGVVLVKVSGYGEIVGVASVLVGAAVPYLEASGAATRRSQRINRGLPGIIDLLALSMSAGLDFPNSIRQVVERSSDPTDPLVEEITLLLQELKLGRTRAQALRSFALRAHSAAVDEFAAAVIQAEERGNAVAEALQIQAEAARLRRTVAAEEAASRAATKLTIPLILLLVAALVLVGAPAVFEIMKNWNF